MSHYDDKYFAWQKKIGEIGGYLNKFKFEKHIKDDNITLMDFGCGGGYLLNNFNVKKKIGFDINKTALEECKKKLIEVYSNFDDILDNSVDIIISNHAMEHVSEPLSVLKELYKKLKNNGTIIIVIPCEQPSEKSFYYNSSDINKHLYTWCPMTFGNLLEYAGFKNIISEPLRHQWCPDYQENYNKPNFHERCIEYAMKNCNYQIKAVATKIN